MPPMTGASPAARLVLAGFDRAAGATGDNDMTRIYPTIPDHGDRFQRVWLAYHARRETSLFWSRFAVAAQMILGAVAGLAVAWVLV